jgi:hypothetical protein
MPFLGLTSPWGLAHLMASTTKSKAVKDWIRRLQQAKD